MIGREKRAFFVFYRLQPIATVTILLHFPSVKVMPFRGELAVVRTY